MKLFSAFLSFLLLTSAFTSCKKPKIKACFTTDKSAFVVNDTITFDLNCSKNPSTSIIWDFGDGTSEESRSLSVKHSYINSGEYNVTLTICEHAMWYKLNTNCDQITKLVRVNQ